MGNDVAIKKMHISGMFDMYDYDIEFNYDGNISCLIAPNGFGKTTILEMITFIYRPFLFRNAHLLSVPFSSVDCELANGKHIGMVKQKVKGTELERTLSSKYSNCPARIQIKTILYGNERLILNYDNNKVDSSNVLEQCLEEILMENERKFVEEAGYDGKSYRNREGDKAGFTYRLNYKINKHIKELQDKYGCSNDAMFITSDRLNRTTPIYGNYAYAEPIITYSDPVNGVYSRLSRMLINMDKRYNNNLNNAKDSFLKGIVENNDNPLTFEEFIKKWDKYRESSERFRNIGFISGTKEFYNRDISRKEYEEKANVLSSYIEAFSGIYEELEDDYKRIKLFKDIFDERNSETGKKLIFAEHNGEMKKNSILNGKGPCVELKNGTKIKLDELSSGEKNDLVMFFKLIFDPEENDVVLIDEPEISLNINWQENFAEYLQKICILNNLHAILATHSPHIINGRIGAISEITGKEIERAQNNSMQGEQNREDALDAALDLDLTMG